MNRHLLHLTNPATDWENASPIGCGSAGCMIWGGVAEERLTFNEESIWDGGPMDMCIEGYADKLRHVRELFLADREYDADQWAEKNMGDCFKRIKAYEYAGELLVSFGGDDGAADYRRDLDLTDGVCTVRYEKAGSAYCREYFASYPDKLIAAQVGQLRELSGK